MRSGIRLILTVIVIALFFELGVCISAGEDTPFKQEFTLLRLINQARENPLAVASSLGMDPDQILRDLPELRDVLIEGLPPLIFNIDLYEAAGAHARDMLANNYYSHTSLDGYTYDDRIRAHGYLPITTGETLGMLGFVNFIDPDEAVGFIFENMFRDELNPSGTEKINILGAGLKEVGMSFCAGALNLDGSPRNTYLTTCDFATSAISDQELEILELINQARENPLAVASSLGMDPDQILRDLPELRDVLIEGLPPLIFNIDLYEAAGAHARDMLANNYYSHTSLDGYTYDDRIRAHGYLPITTGESIRLSVTLDSLGPAEGARIHFERIFKRELSPNCSERNILNPEFKEAGISLLFACPEIQEEYSDAEMEYYRLLLVIDFGASITRQMPYLKGRVYRDRGNENGLSSFGDGLPGIFLTIEGPGTDLYTFTNRAGGFAVPLEPGSYRIIALINDSHIEAWVAMDERNKWVQLKIEPDPKEDDGLIK